MRSRRLFSTRAGAAPLSRKRTLGLALVLVHLLMAVVALGLPWYAATATNPGGGYSFSFSLPDSSTPVTTSCSGVANGTPCGLSGSYAAAGLSSTGDLYTAALGLMLLGIAIFVVGFIFDFVAHTRDARYRRWAVLTMTLGVALCFSSALVLPAGQLGDLQADHAFTPGHFGYGFGLYNGTQPVSTPSTDYINSTSSGNTVLNWAPGLGWWIGGFAFSLGGMILYGPNPRRDELLEATESREEAISPSRSTEVSGSGRGT
jgi:hypothetical protein